MEITGHWADHLNRLQLPHSPAVSALSPEFISQAAVLYSLLSPQDTAFEACVHAQLTALEALSPVHLKAIVLAKRTLLGAVKTALWTKLNPSDAQIATKVDSLDSQLFAEMAELVPEEEEPAGFCVSPSRLIEGGNSLSGQMQSLGQKFAQSAAHLSAKVASETQMLQQYQSLLASNQALESQISGYKHLLKRPKASSDADISTIRKPSSSSHIQRKSLPLCSGSRPMTLRQLLILISEVYSSKDKSDARSRALGLRIEPIWEHLNGYLDTKYGLKVVIK